MDGMEMEWRVGGTAKRSVVFCCAELAKERNGEKCADGERGGEEGVGWTKAPKAFRGPGE